MKAAEAKRAAEAKAAADKVREGGLGNCWSLLIVI